MILYKLNLFLFIFGLILFCYGYEPDPQVGKCPVKETISNFNIDQFLGIWYINARYPFLEEVMPSCVTQNYTKTGNEYGLQERATFLPKNQNKTNLLRDLLEIPMKNISTEGHYVMYTKGANEIAKVSVLDTDYTNYAILYACINFENVYHYESGVIASRVAKPSDKIMELANDTLIMNGIGLEKMFTIPNEIC